MLAELTKKPMGELPNTWERWQVAGTLIVDTARQPDAARVQIRAVWVVDFYRNRPEQR